MNTLLDMFKHGCIEKMGVFHEVYLFGSAVTASNPKDLDLLLVYDNVASCEIESTKDELYNFFTAATGLECHFVTLSRNELAQTNFLNLINYKRIK